MYRWRSHSTGTSSAARARATARAAASIPWRRRTREPMPHYFPRQIQTMGATVRCQLCAAGKADRHFVDKFHWPQSMVLALTAYLHTRRRSRFPVQNRRGFGMRHRVPRSQPLPKNMGDRIVHTGILNVTYFGQYVNKCPGPFFQQRPVRISSIASAGTAPVTLSNSRRNATASRTVFSDESRNSYSGTMYSSVPPE